MHADDAIIPPTHGQQERSFMDDAHRQQAGSSIHEAESLPFKSQNRDVTPGDGLVGSAQRLEHGNTHLRQPK